MSYCNLYSTVPTTSWRKYIKDPLKSAEKIQMKSDGWLKTSNGQKNNRLKILRGLKQTVDSRKYICLSGTQL